MREYYLCLRMNAGRAVASIFLLAMVFAASGCASVVYKDTAATYVGAMKNMIKQLDDVSDRLAKADDKVKEQKISTDAACPIAQKRLFVRAVPAISFSPFLQQFADLQKFKDCEPLIACESSLTCANACYTAKEGNCLIIIEQRYASVVNQKPKVVVSVDSAKYQQLALDADKLGRYLQQVEYGRAGSTANKLVGDSLRILTSYLDMLDDATKASKPDLTDAATLLTKRLTTLNEGYTKLTNNKLSSEDQTSRENIQNYLGAFGAFFDDIKGFVQNAKDAEKIKAFVDENMGKVSALIDAIEVVIKGDDKVGMTLNNVATKRERDQIQEHFKSEKNPAVRLLIHQEIAKYPYSDESGSNSAIQAVFDHLSASHKALVSLVKNPTDEQIKAIRNEEFQQIRSLAEDIAGVLALAK